MTSNVTPQQLEMHTILSDLWAQCRSVIWWIDQIDVSRLNEQDLVELENINRITVGYGALLQNVESLEQEYPTPNQFSELKELIQSHCSRSETALMATYNSQKSIKPERIKLK